MSEQKQKLTSTQMASLVGIMARRPVPSRGALGVKGVKVFVEWVLSYAPPHRPAAIIILTDLLKLEPEMLSGNWKAEATERMEVCVDPSVMDNIQLGAVVEGDDRSEEERNAEAIQAWAAQTDEDDAPDEDADEIRLPVDDEEADPGAYPDFGSMHDSAHGGSIVNEDAEVEPEEETLA